MIIFKKIQKQKDTIYKMQKYIKVKCNRPKKKKKNLQPCDKYVSEL